MKKNNKITFQDEMNTGFKNEDVSILNTGVGLTEEIVRAISAYKNEPDWMLEYRLKAYKAFKELPMPSFGPDLSFLDFDSIFSSPLSPTTGFIVLIIVSF